MSEYNPDVWVVVKFAGADVPDGELYKILAGWYGGYLGADSWKFNSGITKITPDGDVFAVDGYSGSTYRCHRAAERVNLMTQGIFQQYSEGYKQRGKRVTMEIVPIDSILEKFV